MPIYAYACEKCKKETELIQKFEDPAPEKCEECGIEGQMKRILGLSNFHLKGGGWAKDGYA